MLNLMTTPMAESRTCTTKSPRSSSYFVVLPLHLYGLPLHLLRTLRLPRRAKDLPSPSSPFLQPPQPSHHPVALARQHRGQQGKVAERHATLEGRTEDGHGT